MTGVSVQTVSRVINKRPDVSPETRAAVEAAIAEHGFQPSAVARSLVQRRSQMIGVIAAGLKYFGVAQTLNGVTEEAEASGYSIILKELASFELPDIVPVVEFLLAHRVEGIIFAPPQLGANIRHVMDAAAARRAPGRVPQGRVEQRVHDDRDRQRGGRPARHGAPALARPDAHRARGRAARVARGAGPPRRLARRARGRGARARADGGRDVVLGRRRERRRPDPRHRPRRSTACLPRATRSRSAHCTSRMPAGSGSRSSLPSWASTDGPRRPSSRPSLTTVRQPLNELGKLAVHELVTAVNADAGAYGPHAIQLPVELIPGDSAPLPSAAATGPAGLAGECRADSPPRSAPGPRSRPRPRPDARVSRRARPARRSRRRLRGGPGARTSRPA